MLAAAALALAGEQTTQFSVSATAPTNVEPKDANANLAPLPISLPGPRLVGTPRPLPPASARVKYSYTRKPRPPFLAPKGCVNAARGKSVTASDNDPIIGRLDMITDGDKEFQDGSHVEIGLGVQWVQIDLGSSMPIYAVLFWHDQRHGAYYDVIVQVSDDKDFVSGVQTLYNNDHDNSAGMGFGSHFGYLETNEGKFVGIGGSGVRARYVRLYSNGSTDDDLNRYTEVEVYALPGATLLDDLKWLIPPLQQKAPVPIKLPRPVCY